MDNRRRAMIVDGATDLYTLIRDTLSLARGDDRVATLDEATERYLKEVLAIVRDRFSTPAAVLLAVALKLTPRGSCVTGSISVLSCAITRLSCVAARCITAPSC